MEKPPKKKTRLDDPETSTDDITHNDNTTQQDVPEEDPEFTDAPTELNDVNGTEDISTSQPQTTTNAQPEEEESSQPKAKSLNQDAQKSTQTNRAQTTPQEEEKQQSRLVMKKMVLNNFKSYAGRQVIGPFHKVNQ
ncbi:hypothetical protein K501DRAFT_4695 [Backusella circina FSU 941]|nr:hypothetical protein K501DRAFT_4695 [Backusella circina FSU 941]